MTGKYWGEEKCHDAIYWVYLKKVRYVSTSLVREESIINNEEGPVENGSQEKFDSSDHLQWETIRERVIRAGTCQKLVESLIDSDGQLDSRHFNIFFATFRAFTQAENLLGLIIDWYTRFSSEAQSDSKSQSDRVQAMRSTIKSVTICWLEMYPEDFYVLNCADASHQTAVEFPLLEKLIVFGRSENLHDLKHKARKLRDRFRRVYQNGGIPAQLPSVGSVSLALTGYDPNVPFTASADQGDVDLDERYAKLLVEAQSRSQMFDVDCKNVPQIAEQLTFWDALLFRELKTYQCQGSIWGKRNRLPPEAVYSVRATINQFNALTSRVMTSIVFPECQAQFRAQIIEKWINIAKELRILNNYSSLKAVLSSLQSQPVFRLKNIWSLVSKTSMVQFKELMTLFDSNADSQGSSSSSNADRMGKFNAKKIKPPNGGAGNCKRTKSDINIALETQGCVPYLGTFLTELQMIDQALPDRTEEGLINFEKRVQEFEILAKLRLYQSAARAYTIPMDEHFCAWFVFLPALDEKECFSRSLEIEPKSNEQSTPNTRRRAREETNQMTKINSLTKIFSGLNYSSAKEDSLGNSSFFGSSDDQSGGKDNGERSSSGLNGVDSRPATKNYREIAEKPPRGQRSRSQGAKKESRCSPGGLFPGGKRNESHSGMKLNGPSFAVGNRYSGSEFSPQHFTPGIMRFVNPIRNGGGEAANSSDFISNGQECLKRKSFADSPSEFCSSSASSSFGQRQMASGAPHSSADSPKDFKQSSGYSQKENLSDRLIHFHQRSKSSSSSQTSMEKKAFGGTASPSSISVSNCPREEQNFHLVRVGLDDSLLKEHETCGTTNYKCIKITNGDRMDQVLERALEKHLIEGPVGSADYWLVQLLPGGGEFRFPDHCNPFYAVAPDPTSPMPNCVLRKRARADPAGASANSTEHRDSMAESKKLNKEKRNNLLRWSSGFL